MRLCSACIFLFSPAWRGASPELHGESHSGKSWPSAGRSLVDWKNDDGNSCFISHAEVPNHGRVGLDAVTTIDGNELCAEHAVMRLANQ